MMTLPDLHTALDLTLEIEGLLALALRREPDTPDDLWRLLDAKTRTLAAMASTPAPADAEAYAETVSLEETEDAEPAAPAPAAPLPHSMSLNDRFRWARELFGGSVTALGEALNAADASASAPEALKALTARGADLTSEAGEELAAYVTSRFNA